MEIIKEQEHLLCNYETLQLLKSTEKLKHKAYSSDFNTLLAPYKPINLACAALTVTELVCFDRKEMTFFLMNNTCPIIDFDLEFVLACSPASTITSIFVFKMSQL